MDAIAYVKGKCLGNGQQSDFTLIGDLRMTGSAYQSMDVFVLRDSLYRVGVWGRDYTAVFLPPEAGG